MTRERPRRAAVGLRREVSILLPVAFLLVVVLSVFTLFSYRSGIALLVEERRAEALSLAERLAARVASGAEALDLRSLAPAARGVAVLDADGRVLARAGAAPDLPALTVPESPGAHGPDTVVGDAVVGFAPVAAGSDARWVRVELGASTLALQLRGLRVLSWVVLGIDTALVVLVLLFLGRVLQPYDTLLERARTAGEVPPDAEDEVAFLVATFERALGALARPAPTGGEDDIALLQRTIAGSFDSGVLLLDARARVLAVNPAGAALLEVEPRDAEAAGREGERSPAGEPMAEVLAAHPPLVAVLSEAVTEGRGVRRREIETTAPSGRQLTLGLTLHPLRTEDGTPRGFLALFVDLTEVRRQSEQARLAESLRQIGELAAGVAHELRNSLATLKGYLSLIERGDGIAPADYVAEMRRESDHLQRVLEDFLSFARPGTVRLETVDLQRVLARAAADPALAGADVRLTTGAPEGLDGLPLAGDPQLLERAVRNLLQNAAEAGRQAAAEAGGPAMPVVEVAARAADDELEVTIADRGPGVAPEVRERLFQPFASGRAGGVGLGLALARRIVVLHGGRLALEDRPGGGTVARATFPTGRTVTEGNVTPSAELLPGP